MYLESFLQMLLVLGLFSSSLIAQDQADETGTLNTAAIIENGVILTSDSAETSAAGSRSDGEWKIVQVGPQAACTVEGHLDERTASGARLFIIGRALKAFAEKHDAKEHLSDFFDHLMEVARQTLASTNEDLKQNGMLYLRSDHLQQYKQSNGRYYVSGIICAGISDGTPLIRAAHISTDPAVGSMQIEVERLGDHVAQGDPLEYHSVFHDGLWRSFKDESLPEPTWPAFHVALSRVKLSFDQSHSLNGIHLEDYEQVLRGVYWSEITGSGGAILPPVREWMISSKVSGITQRVLDVP